jgi:hypothetical protein
MQLSTPIQDFSSPNLSLTFRPRFYSSSHAVSALVARVINAESGCSTPNESGSPATVFTLASLTNPSTQGQGFYLESSFRITATVGAAGTNITSVNNLRFGDGATYILTNSSGAPLTSNLPRTFGQVGGISEGRGSHLIEVNVNLSGAWDTKVFQAQMIENTFSGRGPYVHSIISGFASNYYGTTAATSSPAGLHQLGAIFNPKAGPAENISDYYTSRYQFLLPLDADEDTEKLTLQIYGERNYTVTAFLNPMASCGVKYQFSDLPGVTSDYCLRTRMACRKVYNSAGAITVNATSSSYHCGIYPHSDPRKLWERVPTGQSCF